MVDAIRSDPGLEFTSNGLNPLNAWLGLGHQLSLVDVHESNRVERTNGEIMRLLRALVNDFRFWVFFGSPEVPLKSARGPRCKPRGDTR